MNVYLWSTIGCNHLTIIPHFIEHYLTIGIRPDRFLITLNAKSRHDPALDQAVAILKQYGIKACNFYIGKFNDPDKKRHGEAVKNKFTKSEDWIVYCDADEFHEYPLGSGDIRSFLSDCDARGYNVVEGNVIDRIAKNGGLRPITEQPSIWEQFPLRFSITRSLGGACIDEVMTHRACFYTIHGNHVITSDPVGAASRGHSLKAAAATAPPPDSVRPCPEKLTVHHFKWDASVIQRLEYAASLNYEIYWSAEASKYLEHIKRFGGFDVPTLESYERPMQPLDWNSDREDIRLEIVEPLQRSIGVNEYFYLHMRLHNGSRDLLASSPPHPVHLAYHWLQPNGSMAIFDGDRSRLLPPIAPQKSECYSLLIKAPSTPGIYRLQPAIVQEMVRWLESPADKAIEIEVV